MGEDWLMYGEYFKSNNRLTSEKAHRIKIDSERLFAVSFLNWFGNSIPLVNKVNPIYIQSEGKCKTIPDFVTPFGSEGILYYEVTHTSNTKDKQNKKGQRRILEINQIIHPNEFHLEVNGKALRCVDYLMTTLEEVYSEKMEINEAQLMINKLGRNENFYLSVLTREMAEI